MRNFSDLVVPILRQSLFGLALLFASLPLLRALHNRFSLGAPPVSAIVLIAICVLIIFIGAAIIGAFSGSSAKARNGLGPILAWLLALGWGIVVCSVAIPFYASSVVDHMTQSVAIDALRDSGAAIDKTRGAVDAVRNGKTGDFVSENKDIAWTKSKTLLRDGAARLPAIGILAIAVLVAPLGAMFECWRARKR